MRCEWRTSRALRGALIGKSYSTLPQFRIRKMLNRLNASQINRLKDHDLILPIHKQGSPSTSFKVFHSRPQAGIINEDCQDRIRSPAEFVTVRSSLRIG